MPDRRERPPVPSVPPVPPVLRITEIGEPILHGPCRPASEQDFGSPELAQLIDSMFASMYVADGCGLAANQVDVDLRLFVYDCTDDDGVRHTGHLLNPVVEAQTTGRPLIEDTEGCLSVPGASTSALARPARAVVRGFDRHGTPRTIEATGYFARCLQHETDHLDGQLYVDRLSRRDRKDVLRQTADRREKVFAQRTAAADRLKWRGTVDGCDTSCRCRRLEAAP
ncbi:peptide deformylase [Streptomyces sp. 1331.2]|uniref:peptide deformylase n=1 Tax=Streptomyces sp. 1331.2 TaxID=1938835 RepID=UPI000BC72D56|nr:peptide deformylase [Streptomyces sp. 1331.2]SOB84848.1 peptide deformylase [Streptomyces sp. 1331.2]